MENIVKIHLYLYGKSEKGISASIVKEKVAV